MIMRFVFARFSVELLAESARGRDERGRLNGRFFSLRSGTPKDLKAVGSRFLARVGRVKP